MEMTAVAIEGDVDAAIAQIDGILQVSGALSKE
jgi:hypothetical protein